MKQIATKLALMSIAVMALTGCSNSGGAQIASSEMPATTPILTDSKAPTEPAAPVTTAKTTSTNTGATTTHTIFAPKAPVKTPNDTSPSVASNSSFAATQSLSQSSAAKVAPASAPIGVPEPAPISALAIGGSLLGIFLIDRKRRRRS